jgi:phosphatidylserine/phosphatidylglycerophosphate/cardiolipin synthase-like enzyme
VAAVTKDWLQPSLPQRLLEPLIAAIRDHSQVSANEFCAMLRASVATASILRSSSSVELVWTGPESMIVPVRHTEQVLVSVIDDAQSTIFLVSFVAFDIPVVAATLERASERGVGISALLEPSKQAGGRVTVDSVAILKNSVPGARFYVWERSPEMMGGSVHAKCVVADARIAFITSANLTGAAMERNIEVGVLIHGGPVPLQLNEQLNALIETKQLRLL